MIKKEKRTELWDIKNIADKRCLALMLALKRQVREIGRIHFPTISITVIVRELKNWKTPKLNSKKYKLEGVVKEKRNKEMFFRFNSKNRVIKKKDRRKIKFKKDVTPFKPKKFGF